MSNSKPKGGGQVTEERLLTPKDVAVILQVSARMVQKLAQRGDLAAVPVGDLLRFRPSTVDEFIRNREKPSAEQKPSEV